MWGNADNLEDTLPSPLSTAPTDSAIRDDRREASTHLSMHDEMGDEINEEGKGTQR